MKKTSVAILSTLGWIIFGSCVSFLCHGGSFKPVSGAVLAVVMMPVFAVVVAAMGPFEIVAFVLYLFRVRGGSFVAVSSLTVGSALMYFALVWCIRARLKAEARLRRVLWGIGLMCYSAFATHCLMYVSARM